MSYQPQPIPTEGITLDDELLQLGERLAASVHDIWAQGRMAEGWIHGPQRDDGAKHHPCLVPYDDLPESEKEYDRRSVEQTLKAILALGWEIRRKE